MALSKYIGIIGFYHIIQFIFSAVRSKRTRMFFASLVKVIVEVAHDYKSKDLGPCATSRKNPNRTVDVVRKTVEFYYRKGEGDYKWGLFHVEYTSCMWRYCMQEKRGNFLF
jgi:hypothetical protein